MAQQTFEELVDAVKQAESRGKRYKDDGKTLTTSSKGALGEMQVMPKTIRDPGFGVVPAKDKSPDEIARVGVDYLQAMKQKYGDTEKALIAYNWGPGSTDKWLASGADPKKLPAETRTYVERVKGFLGKDVPRETSVAKKEREPLPASLPPMAQADIKTPSVKPEAAARVASLGPGYQAALALSFLAETDDEEDRKTTITQEYLAKAQEDEDDQAAAAAARTRQANVFADLSNTTIRSPFAEPQQPVRMKDGGDVGERLTPQQIEQYVGQKTKAQLLLEKFKEQAHPRNYTSIIGLGPNIVYETYKYATGKDPLRELQKELQKKIDYEVDTGSEPIGTDSGPISGSLPPVKRADGSPEEGEDVSKPYLGNPNISRQVGQARRNAAIQKANYRDEVAEAKDIARKGEAYQELEKYLQSRNAVPDIKVTGYLPEGTHGMFSSDRTNIGTGNIKISKNLHETYMPSTIAHEVTHAADRQMEQQAMEQGLFGKSNQFTEAYKKMVGKEGRNRTQLLRKRYPEFEEDNRYYRSRPDEVAAHAIGAYSGPVMQDSAPRHVDATAATEFRILMDLAQRNVDKGPKGLDKILPFFRKFERYADGGVVHRAEGSPKEGERKLDRETMDMLRRQGTSPASLQRVAPPADISSSAAGLPGLMLLADPRIDNTNAYGYVLDSSDDKKNFGMAQAMFLNKSRSEDYPDTIAHETEHLLARQNLGSAANINSKFDELIGNKGTSRLNFVRDAVKAAPYLKEKYDLQSSYLDPKMFEYQSKFGLGKNLLYEQLASLAALEQRHKIDLTKDPELRKTLFSRPDVRETYNALTGLRQTRLDPRDLPPHTRVREPGMLDAIKGVFKRAEGGPVYRADGSPEEGEMSDKGSITVQEAEVAKAIFPSLPVTEAVYLLRGSQRQSTPQGEMLSGNMGARIPLGKDAEAMLMLAGSRPEGRQDSSKALLAMLNQRMGEGSVGAQMVRPMDAPAGTYAGGVSGSYPVGEGRVMGNVNMMRMPGQDARVTDYGVGYGGKVGPGELSAMIMRQKDGPYSGQIQYRLPIGRAEGSPEEGEVAPRLTMQQIERLAAQEAAEREAASTPAFIAQKSGIGRKAGPVSQALQSGQGQIEFLKGMTNVPQNILGAPMDISNMIANVYGGGVEKPFMGSEYIKEGLRAKGLGFTPSTDPTLAAFYGAGDLGSNLVNPAGVTRAGVQAAGKTGEQVGKAARMLEDMTVGNIQRGQVRRAGAKAEDIPDTAYDPLRERMEASGNLAYAVRNKGTPVPMSGFFGLPTQDQATIVVNNVINDVKQLHTLDKPLTNWFQKTVTRYLRSDFASPQDQLVKAAEEGKALHLAPKEFSDSAEDQALKHFLGRRQSDLEYMRQAEGFGKSNMATTPYGQRIEDITDISAYPERVGDLTPNRVPPSMRDIVETQPETRVTDFAPNIVENLKLETLRDKMLDVRQSDGKYGAYGQPAAKIPAEFMLPDDTLAKLNVAAASNRMARYTNWQNETRQRMATTALRADPAFPRAQLQEGKFIGVALPDIKKNPEAKQLVIDVGCDGGWCTRYTPNAEAYASGFNRLHVLVTGEGKQARPVAQFSVADNGPSYDTNRFSITEIKEKGNTADFANNPALPAIQEYVQFLDKTYGGLDYVDNLKGLRMTQLPEYPMRLLELFNPTVQQRRMLENKYGSEENGLRAVRDKAVDLNNGSRFMTGSEDAVANSLEQAMQLLVGPKENLARRIQMNLFGLPKEKATGGMMERQPDDNRRYL